MHQSEQHETPLEWARALLAQLNPTGIEDSAALAASVSLPYFWHENGDLCWGDPTDDRDNYSATELYEDYILEACNNYPRVLGELALVRAEYKCTLFVLGAGYTEELEIHPDKRLLPLLMQRDTQLDGRGRVQWTRVKTILSNVRFNYGPHSDIEVVGEEPPSA